MIHRSVNKTFNQHSMADSLHVYITSDTCYSQIGCYSICTYRHAHVKGPGALYIYRTYYGNTRAN